MIQVEVTIPDTNEKKTKLTPCSPGDAGSIEKTWTDLDSDELLEPPLVLADFYRAISVVKPSVDPGDVTKYNEWSLSGGSD